MPIVVRQNMKLNKPGKLIILHSAETPPAMRSIRTEKGQEKQAYSVVGSRKPGWVIGSDPFLHVFGSAMSSEKTIVSLLVETIMKSTPLYPPSNKYETYLYFHLFGKA